MNEVIKEKMKSLISAYINTRNDNILGKIYDLCLEDKTVIDPKSSPKPILVRQGKNSAVNVMK